MTVEFPQQSRSDLKNEALKRELIERLHEEQDKFLAIAECFNALGRREEKDYLNLCNAIIEAVDRVLAVGEGENSLFVRNTIKPLKKIREQALDMRDRFTHSIRPNSMFTPESNENSIKLYVSLYQSLGHDMKKWAEQLASLGSYLIGRPIYEREQDVIQAIHTKLSQTSEAYLVVVVDKSKIISQGHAQQRKDKFGHDLVMLVPGAIGTGNILEFVHQQRRYHFYENQLVLAENQNDQKQVGNAS